MPMDSYTAGARDAAVRRLRRISIAAAAASVTALGLVAISTPLGREVTAKPAKAAAAAARTASTAPAAQTTAGAPVAAAASAAVAVTGGS